MTYETEIQRSHSNEGDIFTAWVLYLIAVFGLVGYSLISVFA